MLRQLVMPLLRSVQALAPLSEASVGCACQRHLPHGSPGRWQQGWGFSTQQEAPDQAAGSSTTADANTPSTTSSSSSSSSNSHNASGTEQQVDVPSSSAAAAGAGPSSSRPPASADRSSKAPSTTSYGPRLTQNKRSTQFERTKQGIVHINSTLNNTLLVLTDMEGQVKACATGGTAGYRNSGKSTPTAAEQAARDLAQKAYQLGFSSVAVKLKGRGKNKQFAAAALASGGLTVASLQDVTSIPHNGCRLPRKRRL